MADREFPNSGVMYMNQNRREGKNDANGDGNGEITCDCPQCNHNFKIRFFINGWRKDKDRNGNPWWSFSFKMKRALGMVDGQITTGRPQAPAQADMGYGQQRAGGKPLSSRDIDDEIPF